MLKQIEHKDNFFDTYVWNNFIPKDHKYVKIKSLINVDFIPDLVKNSYKNENPQGNNPVDPRTLFLICVAEYLENLSDVKIVEKIAETPVLKWFVGLAPSDKVPDDSTISRFRSQRMGEKKFKEAFYEIVGQIKDMGLIDGQVQCQDATAVWADAAILNVFQLLNRCRLNLLGAVFKTARRKEYYRLLKKYGFRLLKNPVGRQKHFEDLIKACQGLFNEIKKSRTLLKSRIVMKEMRIMQRALEERNDEYFDEDNKKRKKENIEKITGKMVNPSDPDASWGAKSEKEFFMGYKAEINIDNLYEFITAIDVTKAGVPEEQVAADLLRQQQDYLGLTPRHFLADAKYSYGTTRAELKALGIESLYIPEVNPLKKEENVFSPYAFEWNFNLMNLVCPAGYPSLGMAKDDDKLGFSFRFDDGICGMCELRKQCTNSKTGGRRVLVPHTFWDHKEGLRIMDTEEYLIMYKEQRYKSERKNAELKKWHDFERARYRGLPRVRIHAFLSGIAVNIKKWLKFVMGKLKDGIAGTLAKIAALSPPEGVVCLEDGY